jgi:hypothetical protein
LGGAQKEGRGRSVSGPNLSNRARRLSTAKM